MSDIVLIKDLPQALIQEVVKDLAQYTVGFFDVDKVKNIQESGLLGSGVLVSVGKTRAILTAHHVIKNLPQTARLGLVLERTSHPYDIDMHGISLLPIKRGTQDAIGPDLGAIVLGPSIAGSVASIKVFYNLDIRRDRLLYDPPDLRNGFWVAQGFLEERSVIAPDLDGRGMTKGFYNFTGLGGPEAVEQIGECDYFEFPVSYAARQGSPLSWGGMSGGGLWQIPLKRQESDLQHLTPLLSGILFYQHPTTETVCGVRGHGRRSVYEIAYQCLQGCGSS